MANLSTSPRAPAEGDGDDVPPADDASDTSERSEVDPEFLTARRAMLEALLKETIRELDAGNARIRTIAMACASGAGAGGCGRGSHASHHRYF